MQDYNNAVKGKGVSMSDIETSCDTQQTREGLIKGHLSREALLRLVVIAGIIGIALIFISNLFNKQGKTDTKTVSAAEEFDTKQTEEYRETLSMELGNMVASIEGAGKTKLMLTLDGTVKNIYATDKDLQHKESRQKTDKNDNADLLDNEKRTCIVVKTGDGSEQAITLGQSMPSVRGVLIVCEGGGNEEVSKRIKDAVSAALNISASRICVLKMSS